MKIFNSGTYISQGYYKSFQPNKINRNWTIEDVEIITLLGKADRLIGKLDMYSEYIPNIDLYIQMHVVKEATLSSKIEGTKTNVEEAILHEAEVQYEKRDDWQEVQNYIQALNQTIFNLDKLPLSSRLIRDTHKELMQGVRGENKQPGQFRKSQNWIGGATLNDAVFVPPIHSEIAPLIGDLEQFAHNETDFYPDLLKIALIHYQFETIHPFLDGNGRVGRLMITLYMVEKGLLKQPILYLSDFFEKNRQLYYDNLMNAREKNNIRQWYKFFLVGIIETAKSGIQTFDHILKLQREVEEKAKSLGSRSSNALMVMNQLFVRPIIDAAGVCEATGLSMPSSYKLIESLEQLGIIKQTSEAKRGKSYVFEEYLNLFK
jgi:Fic family protein